MARNFGPPLRDRGRGVLTVAASAVVAAGIILLVIALVTQQPRPPEPPDGGAAVPPSPTTSSGSAERPSPSETSRSKTPAPETAPMETSPTEAAQGDPLPASRPTSISIPAIDVQSDVIDIGKTDDGKLAVPQPGPNLNKAAWYQDSPTPGQPGPAIIEGHVATDELGPSVFFELGDLRAGDTITVTRRDNRTVTFTVDRLETFPKNEFPTMQVYGGDLGTPTLRLITCSNFDPDIGSHTGNLIVFAEMTSVDS